jgi:hypothetical protein
MPPLLCEDEEEPKPPRVVLEEEELEGDRLTEGEGVGLGELRKMVRDGEGEGLREGVWE